MRYLYCDVCVIGSGIAGLQTALKAADKHKVFVFAKGELSQSATFYAQGGLAAVADFTTDSFELHIEDTLKCGKGLSHPSVVEFTIKEGPLAVDDLLKFGVDFNKTDSGFDLHQEGGHSRRRILHHLDQTGFEIHRALVDKAKHHPNISFYPHHVAIDLIQNEQKVLGVLFENELSVFSQNIVLATGGASKCYRYCTIPEVSSGDGIAMAFRAGARIGNMEFIQFHPTCLYDPRERNFLISEAIRGEGAILINKLGERFMNNYPLKELEARDTVAAAIDKEIKRTGEPSVFLDCRHLSKELLLSKFPGIYARLLALGMSMESTLIPVVPAAHYTCGGIEVDEFGRSSLEGLYAVGECSFTGLHGANRLASNSLLEASVFANRVASHIHKRDSKDRIIVRSLEGKSEDGSNFVFISHLWNEIRTVMWNGVGIVRSKKRLKWAQTRLLQIECEVNGLLKTSKLTKDLIELRNLTLCSLLIVESSLRREETRGLHIMEDYPESKLEFERDTILDLRDLPKNMAWIAEGGPSTRRPLLKILD